MLCGPELPYGEVVQTFQTGAEASREESSQSICPGGLMRDPSPLPPGPPEMLAALCLSWSLPNHRLRQTLGSIF